MRMACYALHYGSEYLAWSIRSVQDAVDEIHVFYTPVPSYGHWDPNSVNPDNEETLRREAHRFLKKPLIWHQVNANSEGQHRDNMIRVAHERGAESYLVVDADEVWGPGSAQATLDAVSRANRAGRWLAHFYNFWRSVHWRLHDHFMPIRVVDMRHSLQIDEYLTRDMQPLPVYHFGYAQSLKTMAYKLGCHGHKAEFKPGWYENKFLAWTPEMTDLHPVVNGLWSHAERTDEATLSIVRHVLDGHPYLNLDETQVIQ